ncbi:hypothetical protein [Acuticoccus yangtzensis]|uniref:hypothetical protein n=1 Tax=Acuticoccus yangtzensis TaxID=1443441 RepID=UPI0009496EC6|nr:hypothetical protein [Acuticoccus yangtzensis]
MSETVPNGLPARGPARVAIAGFGRRGEAADTPVPGRLAPADIRLGPERIRPDLPARLATD